MLYSDICVYYLILMIFVSVDVCVCVCVCVFFPGRRGNAFRTIGKHVSPCVWGSLAVAVFASKALLSATRRHFTRQCRSRFLLSPLPS